MILGSFELSMHSQNIVKKRKERVSNTMNYIIGLSLLLITLKKKAKHLKSFAFYEGENQVYSKDLAFSIQQRLKDLDGDNDIVEINMIDSNPANNPQPPKRVG